MRPLGCVSEGVQSLNWSASDQWRSTLNLLSRPGGGFSNKFINLQIHKICSLRPCPCRRRKRKRMKSQFMLIHMHTWVHIHGSIYKYIHICISACRRIYSHLQKTRWTFHSTASIWKLYELYYNIYIQHTILISVFLVVYLYIVTIDNQFDKSTML